MATNTHLDVFLNDPTDVFQNIEHRHEIWKDDPFDVASVHQEARERFELMLARATTPGAPSGQILVLRGESGAGKTHLLRAFRSTTHKARAGFVGYVQMTPESTNPGRYILSNLIDSLDQPYDESTGQRTGLGRLATALASRAFDPEAAAMLRNDADLVQAEVRELVCAGADRLLGRFRDVGMDLLRALLYLHRPDPLLKARAIKYLRCEDLAPSDRALLELTPRTDDTDPVRMIEELGRLALRIGDTPMSLVLCFDQLENLHDGREPGPVFYRSISLISQLAGAIPSSLIVVSWLDDAYSEAMKRITQSDRDRLEQEKPVRLEARRSPVEVRLLVAERLKVLYGNSGLDVPTDPLYPVPAGLLDAMAQHRTRDVILACRHFRTACRHAGGLVGWAGGDPEATNPGAAMAEAARLRWEPSWSEHLANWKSGTPDEETALAELLAWAIVVAGEELEEGPRFATRVCDGAVLVDVRIDDRIAERIYIALCNRPPQFGWLGKQIAQHVAQVKGRSDKPSFVLARSDEFPRTKTVEREVVAAAAVGGRTVVIQDADFRTMSALHAFCTRNERQPLFQEWLAEENHLSRLPSVRRILELDRMDRFTHAGAGGSAVPVNETAPARGSPPVDALPSVSQPTSPGVLLAGTQRGLRPAPVTLRHAELTQHLAFLGGTGSGKTTLALGLVEQLLEQGVPCLLVDRKGDLAGYARRETWTRPLADPVLAARRDALAARVEVALFTPGHPEGRPISIGVTPDGLAEMGDYQRGESAEHAAQALGDMLGYKHGGRDGSLRAILIQAVQLLAEQLSGPVTLDGLIQVVHENDPALVARIGHLDTRLFGQLVQNLETLKLTSTQLFAPGGEPLDIDRLLGTGPCARPGFTRLTVISTKFFRDNTQIQFWVAQLLMAALRWASKNPRDSLQAALLFDEADLYLPAQSKPATKAPMEDLLKRGRSAGLGMLLATQSPGDLDYRCRDNIGTWFLGRIKESTALQKLRPMLANRPDVLERLPEQSIGAFHLWRPASVLAFQAGLSVLTTEQLGELELLDLARGSRTRSAGNRG